MIEALLAVLAVVIAGGNIALILMLVRLQNRDAEK